MLKEKNYRLRAIIDLFFTQYNNTKRPEIPYSRIETLYVDEEFIKTSNLSTTKSIVRDLNILIKYGVLYQKKDENGNIIMGKEYASKLSACILETGIQKFIKQNAVTFKDDSKLSDFIDFCLLLILVRDTGVSLETVTDAFNVLTTMETNDMDGIGPILSRYIENELGSTVISKDDKTILESIATEEGISEVEVLENIFKESDRVQKQRKKEKKKLEKCEDEDFELIEYEEVPLEF